MNTRAYGNRDLLTRDELAGKLFVSMGTVDRWVREGKITAVHHPLGKGRGRRVFFNWRDVSKALRISDR